MATFNEVLPALNERKFVTRKNWDNMYIFFGMDNIPYKVQETDSQMIKREYTPSLDDFQSDDWETTDLQWNGSKDDFLPFDQGDKNNLIDITGCKWDAKTGAIRTSNGKWLMPKDSVLDEETEEISENTTNNILRVLESICKEQKELNDLQWLHEKQSEEESEDEDEYEDDFVNRHIERVENELDETLVSMYSIPPDILNLFAYFFGLEVLATYIQFTKMTESVYRARLFSSESMYMFYINLESDYIGCIRDSRKSRAGETWTRGNDYPDGKVNKSTMFAILNRIFKDTFEPISELVRID